MQLHGMEGWFGDVWRLDGKRPTNSTRNERKQQSDKDKQNNKKKQSQVRKMLCIVLSHVLLLV